MIVKANDDCRQEVLAIQLMKRLQQIFNKAEIPLWMRPYEIFVTSSSSAMIEFIPETMSISALKKKMKENGNPKLMNLRQFYKWYFHEKFEEAQQNFIRSLAAYSLFTYLFAIKDRHNGNIMLDRSGHIIHIDFGFMLQNTPGGVNFESAPFKLTADYVDLMDGSDSDKFENFKSLLCRGLIEVRRNLDDLANFITIMSKHSSMPCFKNTETVIKEIQQRLQVPNLPENNKRNEMYELTERITNQSLNSFFTNQYDNF